MKRRKTKTKGSLKWWVTLKDCKKCIYKNCPDKKSNSACLKYTPKKGV